MIWHRDVDFASQFDETRAEIPFLGLPRQVKGIDRDAVSAQAGSGIEGLETERLGGCCVYHFPDIQAHAQAQQLQFIYQGDIHASVNILQQLGHLRCCRRGDAHGAAEDRTI